MEKVMKNSYSDERCLTLIYVLHGQPILLST